MRVIRLLSLRRLRLQPLRALLAAIVVGAGSALVVSIVVVTSSLTQSVEEAGRALAGPAPLRVLGPVAQGGISRSTINDIEASPGVQAAIPLIQAITMVDLGDGEEIAVTVLGFDCSIEALFGDFDCDEAALAGLAVPVIGPALAADLGEGAEVRTNLGRVPLAEALAIEALEPLYEGRVVAFPLERAQAELGRGKGVDVVYVLPDDGASVATVRADLEDDLGPSFAVLGALDPPPVIGIVLSTFIPLFSVISLLTLVIGGILVRNSITLSLEERRRQTAIVGALGGSGRVLVWGTIAEMAALGLVGGLVGTVAGIGVAGPVSGGLDKFMRRSAGISLELHPGLDALLVAVAIGVAVAVAASIGPARRAIRLDVAAELAGRGRRDETAELTSLRRILLALIASAVGVGICFLAQREGGISAWQARAAPAGFILAMAPMVYVVAALVPTLLGRIEGMVDWRRASTRLAFANLRREPRRTGVMAIAIGFAVGVGFITASFNASISQAITDNLTANLEGVEVASIEPGNALSNEARLSPQILKELRHLPGVDSVERGVTIAVGNDAGGLVGVNAFTDPWFSSPVAVGSYTQDGLDAGAVAIGPALARAEGLRPGDTLELETLSGPVGLEVMAVVQDGDFGGRNVLMSYELLEELYGPQAPIQVLVHPEPGVTDLELAQVIRNADLDPGIQVSVLPEVIDRITEQVAEQLSSFDAIQRGLLVMSFVAVLSTLLLVGIQRQREFGMLAAVGMTPAELGRMVITEAALVAAVGTVIALAGSIVQYLALNLITPVIIGFRNPFVVDVGAMVRYGLIGMVVAVAASLYPGRRAARVEVLDALRYE